MPEAIKARRRQRADAIRIENARDPIDDLAGERLLEKFEPLPRGIDQLGDLPEPEFRPPYWVLIG